MRLKNRITVVLIASLPIWLLAGPSLSSASPSAGPPMMIGGPGLVLTNQNSLQSGLVSTSWDIAANAVQVIGLPGSTVNAQVVSTSQGGSSGSLAVEVTPPAVTTKTVHYLDLTQANLPSFIYNEVIALGASQSIAQSMANSMTSSGSALARQSSVRQSVSLSSISPGLTPLISAGTIFNSTCNSASGDAGNAKGYSCLVQTMAQDNQYGTYVEDKITSTGSDTTDWADSLSGLEARDYYTYTGSSGSHSIVEWNPSNTLNQGSPSSKTYSLSYNGIGESVTQEVYPATLNPELSWPSGGSYTGFGTQWNGCNATAQVGAPSVDLANVSSGGSIDAGVQTIIWWSLC